MLADWFKYPYIQHEHKAIAHKNLSTVTFVSRNEGFSHA